MAQLARQQEEARKEEEGQSVDHSTYDQSAADEVSEGQQDIDDDLHHDEDDVIYNREVTEPATEEADESALSDQETSKYESEEETV